MDSFLKCLDHIHSAHVQLANKNARIIYPDIFITVK